MYFDSLEALLAMEGHGPYVWAAYGITLLVLALVLSAPRPAAPAAAAGGARRAAARGRPRFQGGSTCTRFVNSG